MCRWIREWPDDFELLDDGSRPTVRDDYRERVLVPRADLDEVNVHAVDTRHELWQGIQLRFNLAPVVVRAPVVHEGLQLLQLDALRAIRHGFFV